jgi:hypothetical protein
MDQDDFEVDCVFCDDVGRASGGDPRRSRLPHAHTPIDEGYSLGVLPRLLGNILVHCECRHVDETVRQRQRPHGSKRFLPSTMHLRSTCTLPNSTSCFQHRGAAPVLAVTIIDYVRIASCQTRARQPSIARMKSLVIAESHVPTVIKSLNCRSGALLRREFPRRLESAVHTMKIWVSDHSASLSLSAGSGTLS